MEAINIYAELVKSRTDRQGNAPIVIRIDQKGKHLAADPLKIKVPPSFWNKDKKLVKETYPNAAYINSILQNKIQSHRNFMLRRQALFLPVTKEVIVEYLRLKDGFESFYSHAEKILEDKKLKDGGGYDEETKRRYRDELKRMQTFQSELSFSQITKEWLTSYREWMQQTYLKKDGKRMHPNGIWKALAVVRMFYNEAVNRKIILSDSHPFKEFKVGSFETDMEKIKWLEIGEVNQLEEALLKKPMQDMTRRVGWRFLAMCTSGMRISDAMNLDDLFFTDSGDLKFKPHKTRRHDNTAQIPITSDRQRRYFKATLENPLPATPAKQFRTTFNIHLKILAAMAGITLNLTSHVGRHTLGGFLVDADVSEESSKKILGIKSNHTIKTYRHLKEEKLRSEANKLNSIF